MSATKRRLQRRAAGVMLSGNRLDLVLRPVDLARRSREKANTGNDQNGDEQGKTNQNPFLQGRDLPDFTARYCSPALAPIGAIA